MNIICVFIFLIISLLLIVNFKCTFMVVSACSMVLGCMNGVGPFGMYQAVSIAAFSIFMLRYFYWKDMRTYPLLFSSILLIVSYVLSNHYAVYRHYGSLVSCIVVDVASLFVFYQIISKNSRYIFIYIRTCVILSLVVGVYTLVETIISSNHYMFIVNSLELYSQDIIVEDIRFGMKRAQAIFGMHTTLGGFSTMMDGLLLWVSLNCPLYVKKLGKKKLSIAIGLMIIAVFLTGTRSTIAGLAVVLMSFFSFKHVKMKYVFIAIVSVVIGFMALDAYLDKIILSFTDTESVGGSNTDMRSIQFELAALFMMQSPFLGNGISYTFEYVADKYKEMCGAESLWIPIMIDFGMLGITAIIVFIIQVGYYIKKYCEIRLLFFLLGILVFNSLSSIPAFSFTQLFYLFVIIAFLKKHQVSICNSPSSSPSIK